MSEFFNVLPPDAALALLLRQMNRISLAETVAVDEALDRITAVAIQSPDALPSFRRSTMDGFAVRAADTFGAGENLPAFLRVVGEVPMGAAADVALGVGDAAVVHTGGMLPEDADAVVQIEHTQRVGGGGSVPYDIEVLRAVAVGQNVLQAGEDVALGAEVLPAGHAIRPQDVGGLLALGITAVAVRRRPRVAILATGDEIVPPGQPVQPGQVRDINSYTVAAMVRRAGGEPVLRGIVPDELDLLRDTAVDALAEADMLVLSAGSSVSVRDMTGQVIDELGEPGVLLHGVATRPGKPTIVGVAQGKPVLGLPGNPVSAMVQFGMFGVPAVRRMLGVVERPLQRTVFARLSANIASESGREDYVPARLEQDEVGWTAVPVFGKSNLIYTLVRADGLIKVPLNAGGVLAGERVEVVLF